jgi:Flp pilus assembly pilin Flp
MKNSEKKHDNELKKPAISPKGATLIEMALYIALVVIVCIAVVTTLGDKLQGVFQTIVNSI